MTVFKLFAIFVLSLQLGACAVATLDKDAEHVEIAAEPLKLVKCEYLGEVTGTEGHWYTYLFLANRTILQAAIDDLRNRAALLGGDTVFIRERPEFITSVTLLGLVYRCKK